MSDPESTDRPRLAVVGLGNMGSAVLEGALRSGVLEATDVLVCDVADERLERFTDQGCRPVRLEEVGVASRILMAVKPQMFPEVAPALEGLEDVAVITLMAGISTDRIEEMLGGSTRVVRTMPNTPALVNAGTTAICVNKSATASDFEFAYRLFNSVGVVVEVAESNMHAVTATSGSGPAWLFRMAEAWITAAESEGLSKDVAKRLVEETLVGAARLIEESGRNVADLRRSVTSKGGTTAAGLAALDRLGFDDAMSGAISAATRRGEELEKGG